MEYKESEKRKIERYEFYKSQLLLLPINMIHSSRPINEKGGGRGLVPWSYLLDVYQAKQAWRWRLSLFALLLFGYYSFFVKRYSPVQRLKMIWKNISRLFHNNDEK